MKTDKNKTSFFHRGRKPNNYSYTLLTINNYSPSNKKLHKQLQESKKKYRNSQNLLLNSFHRQFLLKKAQSQISQPFLKTQSTYSDSIKNKTRNNSNFFLTKIDIFTSPSPTNKLNSNIIYRAIATSPCKYTSRIKNPSFDFNAIDKKINIKFNSKLQMSLEKRKEFGRISLYKMKSLTAKKLKDERNILEKEINHLSENVAYKKECAESKLFTLRLTAKSLNLYHESMHQYIIFLNNQYFKEKKNLEQIFYEKYELENEIERLKEKITKRKRELQQYQKFKEILLLVKYNVSKLDYLPKDILKKFGYQDIIEKKEIRHEKANKKFSIYMHERRMTRRMTNRKSKIHSIFLINQTTKPKPKEEVNININFPIFESPDEFIKMFTSLERKTYELYKTINDKNDKNKDMEINRNNIIEENKRLVNETEKINSNLEKELNVIKEHYYNSQQVYNYLMQSKSSSNDLSSEIYDKIKKILISLPMNIEKEFNLINFYKFINSKNNYIFHKGKNSNRAIYGLIALEKVYFHFQIIRDSYVNNPKLSEKYFNLLTELKIRKKYQNNIIKKKKEEIERINAINKIISKHKKVAYTQRRKVDYLLTNPIMNIHSKNKSKDHEQISKKENIDELYGIFLTY